MRIIAGKYRGRNLKSPPSLEVRPTSDRLRETLFNVLQSRIQDTRFLDLCAGSGAVGIEALSRGAAHATFVDRSRKMCGLVEANLDLCKIPEEQTTVVQAEASDFLGRLKGDDEAWDIAQDRTETAESAETFAPFVAGVIALGTPAALDLRHGAASMA